ncbi:MAG: hypothetical protein E7Z93_01735 [Cyanobacteria bacterium SIG32]|nr:hypothetical protein [Cyanobacteria bacterium SIG32]
MEVNENCEKIDIPVEEDEATRIRDKRKQMCDQILKIEKDNINRTNKDSDAEMARKIYGIIERLS